MGARLAILPIIGVLLSVFGVIILLVTPGFLKNQVTKSDVLALDANGTLTPTTQQWADPRYKMLLSIWIFNVTNAKDVMQGERPQLTQKGPYSFVETQHKQFNFTANGTRVFYRTFHRYQFSQHDSCPSCLLNDRVTVPNILLQKLLELAEGADRWSKLAIEEVLSLFNETVFVTVPVGNLLFDGYKDQLIDSLCSKPLISSICKAAKIPEKIGLFYGQNNTDDGLYEIDTGLNAAANIGHVFSWNNFTVLPNTTWYGRYARMINGTDGQLFPPFASIRDGQTMFIGKICRSIDMDHVGEGQFDDVDIYRYGPANSTSDIEFQRRLGFCNPNAPRYFDDYRIQPPACNPRGLMDVSSCLPGNPPIFISQPNFYGAPAALREAVEGLSKPSENDKTFVEIQPVAGVVVRAMQRSQINLGVRNGNFSFLSKMKNTIIPILWLNETALFDNVTRGELQELSNVSRIASVAGVVVISLGAFIVLLATLVLIIYKFYKSLDVDIVEDEEPLVEESTAEAE